MCVLLPASLRSLSLTLSIASAEAAFITITITSYRSRFSLLHLGQHHRQHHRAAIGSAEAITRPIGSAAIDPSQVASASSRRSRASSLPPPCAELLSSLIISHPHGFGPATIHINITSHGRHQTKSPTPASRAWSPPASSLLQSAGIAITYESLRQLRRLPRTRFSQFWRKDAQFAIRQAASTTIRAQERQTDTCEDWEMGHFYHSRVFHASTPSPPLPRWPFAWVKRAISFTDDFYAQHTGMDTVVYVRFLRACLYWVLLQSLTTAPILLAIHIHFSRGVQPTDMARASLSYLVSTPEPGCDINGHRKVQDRRQRAGSLAPLDPPHPPLVPHHHLDARALVDRQRFPPRAQDADRTHTPKGHRGKAKGPHSPRGTARTRSTPGHVHRTGIRFG